MISQWTWNSEKAVNYTNRPSSGRADETTGGRSPFYNITESVVADIDQRGRRIVKVQAIVGVDSAQATCAGKLRIHLVGDGTESKTVFFR